MSNKHPKKSGETAAEKNPSVESELIDKPSDFKPVSELKPDESVGERHTPELIPGPGTGLLPPISDDASPSNAKTLDSPLNAFNKALENDTEGRIVTPEGDVIMPLVSVGPESSKEPEVDADLEPSNRITELQPTFDPPPRDGLLRYRVWASGRVRCQGKLRAAGSILNLSPEEAKELVDLGRLELVAATSGADCPKCGKGTYASIPCSKECFAAAGYNPDIFDAFVADRKRALAEVAALEPIKKG